MIITPCEYIGSFLPSEKLPMLAGYDSDVDDGGTDDESGLKITAGQWPDKMTVQNNFWPDIPNFRRTFDRSSAYFGRSLSVDRPLFWALYKETSTEIKLKITFE